MSKLLLAVSFLVSVSQVAMAAQSFKTLSCKGKVTDFAGTEQTVQLSQTLTVLDASQPGEGFASVTTKVFNDEIEVGASAIQSDRLNVPKTSVVIRLDDKKNQVGMLSGTGGGSLLGPGYIPASEGALLNYNRMNKDASAATLSVVLECLLK